MAPSSRTALGLLVLAVAACRGGVEPRPGAAPGTQTPIPTPVPTSTAARSWPYVTPVLGGDALVRTWEAELTISYAPPGAAIMFFRSNVGQGDGPCDPVHGCASILDPVEYGTATADAFGYASFVTTVAADEAPRGVLFQARVYDTTTGTGTWSTVALRDVQLHPEEANVGFANVAPTAGVDAFTVGNTHTGGVAWIDYNGDLWPDLFVSNGAGRNHRLYRNDGDGHFTDFSDLIRRPLGLEDAMGSFADIDGDGDDDLLVVVDSPILMDSETVQPYEGGPNKLYVNDGAGGFTEEAAARGLVDPRGWRNITGSWSDVDNDGDVDLFLGNWAMNSITDGLLDNWSRLMINDGTGHFTESDQVLGYGKDVLTSAFFDLDLDGWSDLYIGNVNEIHGYLWENPEADDDLYRNVGGRFDDVTADSPGLGDDAWAAMGLTVADVDSDGDLDLYEADRFEMGDHYPRGSALYLNQGDGTFTDNTCDLAGICGGYSNWPVAFQDFDRDGLVDLYAGVSLVTYQSQLWTNNGDGTFTANAIPSFEGANLRGGATADFDGDGAVDIAGWPLGGDLRLYWNNPRNDHHWVSVKLRRPSGNTGAIGATARLTSGGRVQLRQVSGSDSAHSQSEAMLHFGLGTEQTAELEVLWPGGTWEDVGPIPVDRVVVVDEGQGILDEVLVETSAIFDLSAGELTVTARSNYGGRTSLALAPGPLVWDPDQLSFVGVFANMNCPHEVAIRNGHGDVWVVPVSTTP